MSAYWPVRIIFSIFISLSCSLSYTFKFARQRGVSPMLTPLYDDGGVFACLDGQRVLKYSQVNDDYCDCHDGSDEPGTNACDSSVFHCPNVGYHVKDISSSRVDDGICDCCDGTDEQRSKALCVINCYELGKQEMNEIKVKTEIVRQGIRLKYELEKEGRNLKAEYDKRIIELEQKKKDLEVLVDAKTHLKNDVQKIEREAIDNSKKQNKAATANIESEFAFAELDVDHNGLLDISDIETRIEFDTDQNGVISMDEAQFLLQGRENITRDEFFSLWPKMKHYLTIKTVSPVINYREVDSSEDQRQANIGDIVSGEDKNISDDEIEADVEIFSGVDSVEGNFAYDADTREIINEADRVRDDLDKTKKQLEDLAIELRNVEKWMQIDYGVGWEFATLNGKCFSFIEREYTYKFCPFESTSQKQNVGGMEISLGIWDGWSQKGTKYREMHYSGGASCWNGPQRSAKVKLECGVEHIVTSVLEPIRCEYEFVFLTPAVCNVTDGWNDFHDEL